jgi:hypothetical protein
MKPRYRNVLVITGLIFIGSLLLTGALAFYSFGDTAVSPDSPPQKSDDSLLLIAVVSMCTSIGSAIAFVSTFVLSWTKERRERAMFAMDTERKKLENEKLLLELEQMKKNRGE